MRAGTEAKTAQKSDDTTDLGQFGACSLHHIRTAPAPPLFVSTRKLKHRHCYAPASLLSPTPITPPTLPRQVSFFAHAGRFRHGPAVPGHVSCRAVTGRSRRPQAFTGRHRRLHAGPVSHSHICRLRHPRWKEAKKALRRGEVGL